MALLSPKLYAALREVRPSLPEVAREVELFHLESGEIEVRVTLDGQAAPLVERLSAAEHNRFIDNVIKLMSSGGLR